ncbi:MAG TPA: hypothetical protein PLA50_01975 [Bacteroidia bacterium]|nr:hypothetical protein [Bacteroidia bacterium]
MSYHVYFSFSTSFSRPQRVPKGTLARIWEDIEETEKDLGLKRFHNPLAEGDAEKRWCWRTAEIDMLAKAGPKIDTALPEWWLADRERDKRIAEMGSAVRCHNDRVRRLYEHLREWQGKKWKRGESERITVEQSLEFWGGLQILDLPRELWDREHFTDHMEHLYELLSTGSSRGKTLEGGAFDAKRVADLIWLLEGELDQWGFDARFEIPLDENLEPYDFIASSYNGGYDWCSKCGPILSDDFYARCRVCPHAKKGECELKNDYPEEFEDEEE